MHRVKVEYNKEKLIIPVVFDEKDEVSKLLDQISERFAVHLGKSKSQLNFMQVLTSDGFLFDSQDKIKDVLRFDDLLTVVDQATWLQVQEKCLSSALYSFSRSDFAESDMRKYLSVGLHSHNKIYVKVSKGKTICCLGLFDLNLLQSPTSFEKEFVNYEGVHKTDKKLKWNAKAKVIAQMTEGLLTKLEVELSLQTCADKKARIDVIELEETTDSFAFKIAKTVQSPFTIIEKEYKLPQTIQKGDTLDKLTIIDKERNQTIKPWEGNKSQGNSALALEQIEQAFPDTWTIDKTPHNLIMVDTRATTEAEQVTIVSATSEYKNAEGNWVPTANTLVGSKSGYYSYSWNRKPYTLVFSKKSPQKVALRAEIPLSGRCEDRQRRVHFSLPFPLEVRFTLMDSKNEQVQITVLCYDNEKIEPTTQEKESSSAKLDWWIYADDTETLQRLWLGGLVYKDSYSSEQQFKMITKGGSICFSLENLFQMAYDACKENKQEIAVEMNSNVPKLEIYLMVDLEACFPYAFHFKLETPTSLYETYHPIPHNLLI